MRRRESSRLSLFWPQPFMAKREGTWEFVLTILIMRNTLLGRRQEGRRFEFVFLATLIAGFWSLMSGLVLVMTLQACGLLIA